MGPNTNACTHTSAHLRALRIHINKYAPQHNRRHGWSREEHDQDRDTEPSNHLIHVRYARIYIYIYSSFHFLLHNPHAPSLAYRDTDISAETHNRHEHIQKPCARIPRALVVNCINLCTAQHIHVYRSPYTLHSYSIIFYSYTWNARLTSAVSGYIQLRIAWRGDSTIIIHTLHNIHTTHVSARRPRVAYIVVVSLRSHTIRVDVLFGERSNHSIQRRHTRNDGLTVYGFALFLSVSLSRIRKRPVLAGVRFEKKTFFF